MSYPNHEYHARTFEYRPEPKSPILTAMNANMTLTKSMERRLSKKSKRLSWLLRHGASEVGLDMDAAGWVAVRPVLETLGMTLAELEGVVAHNNKQRLQLVDGRVRACQGHSKDNRAVTRDALEQSWSIYESEASIWHGTTIAAARSIAVEGICAVARTHVHLAPTLVSKVGKRAAVQVMLEVSPARVRAAGITIYAAPNGVILARSIPASSIVGVRPMCANAKAAQAELEALFAGA